MHTKLFGTYYNVTNRIMSLIWLYNKVADIALNLSDVKIDVSIQDRQSKLSSWYIANVENSSRW
jgi:hypothetical protein